MGVGFRHDGPRDPIAYARAALDAECGICASTMGDRNEQLNRSAFALGQFVGAGLLGRFEAEQRLFVASTASGYTAKDGPAAAKATIKSGLDKGERQPRHLGHGEAPRATVHVLRPKPKLSDVELPAWTEPGEDGKPKFGSIGRDQPFRFDDEARRHLYVRDGVAVRVKAKSTTGKFVDWYLVRRPGDGAVGWQARKPEGYVPCPYVPEGCRDPFDPERCGQDLAWAEGEKDADALHAHGFLSFTFGSAGDVPDVSDLLRDHAVIVVVDADAAGHKSIPRKVGAAIAAGARSVRLVRFAGRPDGFDAADYFAAGYGAEGFLDLAERIDPAKWRAEREAEAAEREGAAAQPKDDGFGPQAGQSGTGSTSSAAPPYTITAQPFVWQDPRTFPCRRWLYARHLVRKFLSCTVAPGGVGKSSLQLVEAIAMASGRPLLGIQVREPLRVWIINLEDPLEELRRRVLAVMLHFNIHPDDLGGRLFLNSGRDTKVVIATTTRHGTVLAQPVVDAFTAEIKAKRVDVVVIDPLVKAHQVPENDNGAVDMVCTAFATMADECDCAFDLIHHVRKTNGAEVTVEDGRGAVALLAACRSARALNRMSKDEAEKAGVEDARLYFRAENGKGNLAPPEKAEWFHLRNTPLGNGDPDLPFDNGDQVAVATSWTWPDALDGVRVTDLRKVQSEVSRGEWRENIQTRERWVGRAVARAMGLDADKPADRTKIKGLLAVWMKSGALKAVDRADAKREIRTFVEVGEWATD